MTNYIEEMMKTAGVEPGYQEPISCQERKQVYGLNCLGCMKYDEDNDRCLANLTYPDFTAEKQLDVIKLLNDTSDFHCAHNTLSSLTEEGAIEVYNENFTQALAQLTTELMNANELDKEKVKGILEGC